MKFRRLATGIVAASCVVGMAVNPVAQANASTHLTSDADGSSWFTDPASGSIGTIVNTLYGLSLAPIILSSIFAPGCHMMNTPACIPKGWCASKSPVSCGLNCSLLVRPTSREQFYEDKEAGLLFIVLKPHSKNVSCCRFKSKEPFAISIKGVVWCPSLSI